jgi:hypothetical protein
VGNEKTLTFDMYSRSGTYVDNRCFQQLFPYFIAYPARLAPPQGFSKAEPVRLLRANLYKIIRQ